MGHIRHAQRNGAHVQQRQRHQRRLARAAIGQHMASCAHAPAQRLQRLRGVGACAGRWQAEKFSWAAGASNTQHRAQRLLELQKG